MQTFTAQRGEWFEIGGTLKDPVTGLPRDVTGRTVSLTVRTTPASTGQSVTVDGVVGAVDDGPAGKVYGGGRIATAGTYYATLEVTDATPAGQGWPVREVCKLVITDCP